MVNIFDTKLEELRNYAQTEEVELTNLKDLLLSKHKYKEAEIINETLKTIQQLKAITAK
jgi:hypothetical protein